MLETNKHCKRRRFFDIGSTSIIGIVVEIALDVYDWSSFIA